MEKHNKYTIEISWSDEDDCYVAVVPDLKGCAAHGYSYEEALQEIKVAMEGWLEVARDNGFEIPKPSRKISIAN